MCTYQCFPGVILTSAPYDIISKPLAAFPHDHLQTMDNRARGMNPVVMTIINHQEEHLTSQRFKPATSCSQVSFATD